MIPEHTLEKLDRNRCYLPEPAPEVVGELIAEIRELNDDKGRMWGQLNRLKARVRKFVEGYVEFSNSRPHIPQLLTLMVSGLDCDLTPSMAPPPASTGPLEGSVLFIGGHVDGCWLPDPKSPKWLIPIETEVESWGLVDAPIEQTLNIATYRRELLRSGPDPKDTYSLYILEELSMPQAMTKLIQGYKPQQTTP